MEGHYICQAGIFAGEAVLPQITFLSTMCHKKPYIFIFFGLIFLICMAMNQDQMKVLGQWPFVTMIIIQKFKA